MKILALNAGSSSIKASLFELSTPDGDGSAPAGLCWESHGDPGQRSLEDLLSPLWTGSGALLPSPHVVAAIGHRVVHGGAKLLASTRITSSVRVAIAAVAVAEYAPAHNDSALALIDAAARLFGEETPQVAVFDTSFHRTMSAAAFAYPGPYSWLQQGIRRYGFHGINHQYVSRRAAQLLDDAPSSRRIVTCHLGSGCSLAAVQDGRSVDTTMGFTPLDGIPMAQRSGALDPGILIHLLRHGGQTAESLDQLLNHASGLAGLSGTSGDMRAVLSGADAGDERARLAFDVFVHRVRQGIAAMAAAMGGVDAVVFTGGVGEHSPRTRAAICESLGFLGVSVDAARNAACEGEEVEISGGGARARVLVIPAQENWMVARECVRVVESKA